MESRWMMLQSFSMKDLPICSLPLGNTNWISVNLPFGESKPVSSLEEPGSPIMWKTNWAVFQRGSRQNRIVRSLVKMEIFLI